MGGVVSGSGEVTFAIQGKVKKAALIKAGACEAQKWGISEGSLAGSVCFKVPIKPSTKTLREYLHKRLEPAAWYYDREGRLEAEQWRLPRGDEYRPLISRAKAAP